MTTATPAFQQLQRQFLACVRNPEQQPPSGIPQQGMSIYSELLYNKFDDSLSACFPVTQAMLGPLKWRQLLKTFIAFHQCLSPYYRQIPDEFIFYLQHERNEAGDPPYLAELAHFEWIEMILAIAESEPIDDTVVPMIDWLTEIPIFAPVIRLLHYLYPVQRIKPGFDPVEPSGEITNILGFRDAADAVQFIELNAATARLVEICIETGCTGGQALQQICLELNHPEPLMVFAFGVETLHDLAHQGAIIGSRAS